MRTPDKLISTIRASFIGAQQVYTDGSCIGFYYILKAVFPNAKPYWSKEAKHMITRIGNSYYDITGRVTKSKDYLPDTDVWSAYHVAVAFPQKVHRKVRFTTPQKF